MVILIISIVIIIIVAIALYYVKRKIDEKNEDDKGGVNEKEGRIHTSQDKLPFDVIRAGIVKLKDGTYSKALEVSSINTQLMEGSERETVKNIWGDILNSVKYDIQFLKQSRIVDIEDYLDDIKEKFTKEESEERRKHLYTYHQFMSRLVKENSLQTKKDYVILSHREEQDDGSSLYEEEDNMKKYRKNADDGSYDDELDRKRKEFERARKTLNQRASSMSKSLRRLEIHSRELSDEELFKLYYTAYNKNRVNSQSLDKIDPIEYTSLYVKERREE